MKYLRKFWRDEHGQDLAEYALMTGFVAFAAGAIMPDVTGAICRIFESIKRVMLASAHTDTLSGDVPTVLIQTTQQATSGDVTSAVVRIVCAVMAVTILSIIVLRRRHMDE